MLMKRKSLLLLAILVGSLLLTAVPAGAAPLAQGGNLANSPGFEGAFGGAGTDTAWAPWHEETACDTRPADFNYACRPTWSAETVSAPLIHSGGQSQHVGVYWTPWHGGVFQTVNAPAGARVRLTAWGRARASADQYPAPSDTSVNSRMQVGIDPNGGGIWYQNVTWSGEINPHDVWQAVSVEATVGQSGKVSVYLSSNFKGYSRQHLDAWWDDVTLEVVTPPTATPAPIPTAPPPPPATRTPAPTPTPEPTATPESSPTPTNTPEPTPTATPATASICVMAYDDGNRNGQQDGIEGAISGVTLTLFDGQQIVATQTSNALEGQFCFEDLQPGPYQVFQAVPTSRQLTTADNVPVNLQAGQVMLVLFGSVAAEPAAQPTAIAQLPDPTSAPTSQPAAGGDDKGLSETLLAVSGIVVLLIAAVLVGVFFVFRSK